MAWWRFGNVVVINHSDRFITIYGHCDTINVKPGQQVKQGQVIAAVGSTGWSTNSPAMTSRNQNRSTSSARWRTRPRHLHYEVRTDIEQPGTYVPIDPRIYILNYQWNNEATLLMKARTSKDYKNLDPLPQAFIGRRRG